jgi:hypothetical protein
MIFIWKNKGILVPIYVIVSFVVTSILFGVLHRNIGGIFSMLNFHFSIGLSFLVVSIWLHLTKDDYYKDKNGNKKKIEVVNSFFFIKLEIWVVIFAIAGFILIASSIFSYFQSGN